MNATPRRFISTSCAEPVAGRRRLISRPRRSPSLDLDPDLQRLGDALRASAIIDLAREQQAAHTNRPEPGRAGGAGVLRSPRALAGGTLGLAGVGAALVLALGGSAAPPAFGKTALAVTRQHDGSVLVKVNVNTKKPWVLGADRKLTAMGIDEQIAVGYKPGAAAVSGPVDCTPLSGANTPAGPPVRVLFRTDGTRVIPSGNTGAGTVHLSLCVYYKSVRFNGSGNTGSTGKG
jgi:hypothetical protein